MTGAASFSTRLGNKIAATARDLRERARSIGRSAGAVVSLSNDVHVLRQLVEQSSARQCPVCMATFPEFVRFKHRPHARCPRCSTLERGRTSWLYLLRRTDLLTGDVRMLHVAPEASLRTRLEHRLNVDYVATNYDPDKPDEGVDLQSMPFADESFDLIFCSHVLEHVPDDRLAMREMYRVLRSGGLAVVLVPTRNQLRTYEDATITTPEGRAKAFGRFDHLRWYGKDVTERLRDAGFDVAVEYFADLLSVEERNRYGLVTEPIFACRKPEAAPQR